MQGTMNIKFTY